MPPGATGDPRATGYGRACLSRQLWHRQRLRLSPNTIRHILRRRKLREVGVKVLVAFALLPPIVLDRISTDWVLGPGSDLLTHYKILEADSVFTLATKKFTVKGAAG
jgi:hypothetical protein